MSQMDLHKHRDGFARLERQLLDSKAFRSMTKTGVLVVLDFLSFIQWETKPMGKRGKITRAINGDALTYSFDEAQRRGLPRVSFNRGLTEAIGRGFLCIKKHGSGLQKDSNVYAWSSEWQKYGTPTFTPGARPKAKSGSGFRRGHGFYPAREVDGRTSRIVPWAVLEAQTKKAPTSTVGGT